MEFQDLANAASALDADGNNITTGIAGDFLGFFANLSAIPALSITDGSWAAFVGSGAFEIQDPTGFYSSEHWNSYNPFRGSGARPWATIELADGTTLEHTPFEDPDTGVISDWRIVNTSGHAENFATAIGEAFFVSNERKIRIVTAYTPHEEDEVRYVAVPYHGPSRIQAPRTADVDVEFALRLVDSGIPLPDSAWFWVNVGRAETAGYDNMAWYRINRALLDAKTKIANATTNRSTANSVRLANAVDTGVDGYFAVGTNGNIYFTTLATTDDALPLSIAEEL